MNNSKIAIRVSIGFSILMLVACASDPTTADLMRQNAAVGQELIDLQRQLANDLETGEELVSRGERRVSSGERRVSAAERDLERGQEEIERGRREIAEGQALIIESNRRFRENFPGVNVTPGQ